MQRGNREGIGLVRFVHRRRDGQVDDANVQRVAILDGVFDGRNHVADAAGAGAVERLQGNQPGRGSNARALPVGVVAVAGDDAGDVRAVTVIVVGHRLAAHEIDESIDALRAARVGEIVVVGDPRIDHRDANPGAVETELLAHLRGTHRRTGPLVCSDGKTIEGNTFDRRIVGKPRQRGVRQRDDVPVDPGQGSPQRASRLEGGRARGAAVRGVDDDGRPPRSVCGPFRRKRTQLSGVLRFGAHRH